MHCAGLISENLKLQGLNSQGCSVLQKIAPNIASEEVNHKIKEIVYSEVYEIQYTEVQYLSYLCKAADMLKLADRSEAIADVNKLAKHIFERNREVFSFTTTTTTTTTTI